MNLAIATALEQRKPFTTYSHYRIRKGTATIAASVDDGFVSCGLSYCFPKDKFNKSRGREIAAGRREKGSPSFRFVFKRNDKRLGEQIRAEFEAFVQSPANSVPGWVRFGLARDIKKRMKAANVIDIKKGM